VAYKYRGKEMKTLRKLLRNKRGVSVAISSVILTGVTIVLSIVVLSFSQFVINEHHAEIGEVLTIEKVIFTDTEISAYVRNIGHGNVKLYFARVNGKAYDFNKTSETDLTLPEGSSGKWVTISGYQHSTNGAYAIEFITTHWRVFSIGVKYS
jgi:hypothetical protein